MTTPRIETNDNSTSIDASFPEAPECTGEPAPVEPRRRGGQEADRGDSSDASDLFYDAIGAADDTLTGVANAVTGCAEAPSDRVAALQDGETAVGSAGVKGEFTAGVGVEAGASAEYSVSRDGDRYDGRFAAELGAGAAVGAKIQGEGVDVGVDGAHRVVVTASGTGEAARRDFERIVDVGNADDIVETVEAADDVQLRSVIWETDTAVSAQAGVEAETKLTMIRGAEFDEAGNARAVAGFSVESSVGVDTPSVTIDDDEVAGQAIKNALPVQILPDEAYTEIARANGGMAGIDVELSWKVEARHSTNLDDSTTTLAGSVRGEFGETTIEGKLTGSYDRSTAAGAKIDLALQRGDLETARRIAEQSGIELSVKVTKTEFDGCAFDGGGVKLRNGVERRYDLHRTNLRMN